MGLAGSFPKTGPQVHGFWHRSGVECQKKRGLVRSSSTETLWPSGMSFHSGGIIVGCQYPTINTPRPEGQDVFPPNHQNPQTKSPVGVFTIQQTPKSMYSIRGFQLNQNLNIRLCTNKVHYAPPFAMPKPHLDWLKKIYDERISNDCAELAENCPCASVRHAHS